MCLCIMLIILGNLRPHSLPVMFCAFYTDAACILSLIYSAYVLLVISTMLGCFMSKAPIFTAVVFLVSTRVYYIVTKCCKNFCT